MKSSSVLPMVGIALAASLMVVKYANAARPNQSQAQLEASASHALTGTVQRTYQRKEKTADYEYTYGVAEVAVDRVTKGAEIVSGDRIFVRYWRKEWIGAGSPPPDHYGHRSIPEKMDIAEIYVKGDRKSGFDVLDPNGFFKVTKAPAAEKNLSP